MHETEHDLMKDICAYIDLMISLARIPEKNIKKGMEGEEGR